MVVDARNLMVDRTPYKNDVVYRRTLSKQILFNLYDADPNYEEKSLNLWDETRFCLHSDRYYSRRMSSVAH
jgi:hypothetical protein